MPTNSFKYLVNEETEGICYLDTACQSLRPKSVIEMELGYYTHSNACAGRGNHDWVLTVDATINQTRKQILNFLGKDPVNYTVVFTPNTTYSINLILQNLNSTLYSGIITSEKEHNSVLLPAMAWAKKTNKDLYILPRTQEHSLDYTMLADKPNHILIFNTTSNLDGTCPSNLPELVNFAKKYSQLVLLDATQSLAHHNLNFTDADFDCLFASGHKMYAPSCGFMVIKRDLLKNLDQTWVGGGTVQKATYEGYELIDISEELHARLEFGLQDYAAIFGLSQALEWLRSFSLQKEYELANYQNRTKIGQDNLRTGVSKEAIYYIESLSKLLFSHLQELQNQKLLKLLNYEPSPIISFLPRKVSSYELTRFLSEQGILCRSGYMCCHPFIKEILGAGPLTRISLGLHNTPKDIARLLIALEQAL